MFPLNDTAFGAVEEMMYLAFQNRFEIRLHFASRHFNPYGQRQCTPLCDLINLGAKNFITSIRRLDL